MADYAVYDAATVLAFLWQTTLTLGIAYGVSLLWRRRPARAHYCLVLGLAAAVVLPAAYLGVRNAGWGLMSASTPAIDASTSIQGAAPLLPPDPGGDAPMTAETWGTQLEALLARGFPWLVTLWGAVSAIFLLRLFASLICGLRLLAAARPLINERLNASLETAMRCVGMTRAPIVFTTARVHCPAIWCWSIHPAVLLPSSMIESRSDDAPLWTSVFSHEIAHLKRRDQLGAILAETVCCILWWHPLAWLCRNRLNALSDEACDRWVVASGQPADQYAEALLSVVPQVRTLTALSMVSGKRCLRRRLAAVLDAAQQESPGVGRRWAMTMTAMAVCLTGFAACLQTREDNQLQTASSNHAVNAGMEEGVTGPDSWEQGQPVDGVEYIWDRTAAKSGSSSLCLKKTAQRYFPIAEWRQKVGTSAGTDGVHLTLGASVKAENAYKAVLDVQYIDAGGEWKHEWAAYIGAKNNGDPPANHDWTQYSGDVEIPAGATDIAVGLQLYGPGTVWFDDVSLTLAAPGGQSAKEQPKAGVAQ